MTLARKLLRLFPLLFLTHITVAQNSAPAAPLHIQTPSLPRLTVGQRYRIHLGSTGGTGALKWRVAAGNPPPGLQLNTETGDLIGAPTTPGEFSFVIEVADSSQPPQVASQQYFVRVVASLTIVWKQYPQVQGNTVAGRVAVSNYSGDIFDLTVIIVAVNEIGRATALGYQHLDLQGGVSDLEIPFSGSPGAGKYIVHADAIAEAPSKNAIYRARLRTAQPLAITQP